MIFVFNIMTTRKEKVILLYMQQARILNRKKTYITREAKGKSYNKKIKS